MARGGHAGVFLGGIALLAACGLDDRLLLVADAAGSDGAAGVHQLLLGTFEQGTLLPDDPRFERWEFGAVPPGGEAGSGTFAAEAIVAPGYRSAHAVQLDWQVTDTADGQPNYPGVLLSTGTGSIDLSGYARLVFAQRYQHQGSCRAVPLLTVMLVCRELKSAFLSFAGMSSDWTPESVDFGNLQEATGVGVLREICLKQIDHVYFSALVSLADGECASGTLSLDEIAIQM